MTQTDLTEETDETTGYGPPATDYEATDEVGPEAEGEAGDGPQDADTDADGDDDNKDVATASASLPNADQIAAIEFEMRDAEKDVADASLAALDASRASAVASKVAKSCVEKLADIRDRLKAANATRSDGWPNDCPLAAAADADPEDVEAYEAALAAAMETPISDIGGIHPGTVEALAANGPVAVNTLGDFRDLEGAQGEFWNADFTGIGREGKGKVEEAIGNFWIGWSKLHPRPEGGEDAGVAGSE